MLKHSGMAVACLNGHHETLKQETSTSILFILFLRMAKRAHVASAHLPLNAIICPCQRGQRVPGHLTVIEPVPADIRWKQRFSNYLKAKQQLVDGVDLSRQRPLSRLEQQGLIKAFEFTQGAIQTDVGRLFMRRVFVVWPSRFSIGRWRARGVGRSCTRRWR